MSEAMTALEPMTGGAYAGDGLLLRGHVEREAALNCYRAHLDRVRAQVEAELAALGRGDVRVFHQYGVMVARNRKEVLS